MTSQSATYKKTGIPLYEKSESVVQGKKKLLKTLLAIYHLVEKVIIVKAIIVLQHLALDLRCIHPGNKILHASCHQKCRVCHCIWTHSNIWCHCQSSSQVFSQDTNKFKPSSPQNAYAFMHALQLHKKLMKGLHEETEQQQIGTPAETRAQKIGRRKCCALQRTRNITCNRIRPCSTNVTASLMFSAILSLTNTTASLRLPIIQIIQLGAQNPWDFIT